MSLSVILHVGAHRCATTSFQNYLRRNSARLSAQGLGFWGPLRTRGGLLRGVVPRPGQGPRRDPAARAAARVALNLARLEDACLARLLVSDENMLGFMRDNRLQADLYPAAGDRIARHAAVFGDRLRTVVLNLRADDTWWASALGFGLLRGWGLPGRQMLDRVAGAGRGWREVVADIACAAPQARILVLPFERFAGRPEAQLAAIAGIDAPREHARDRLNPTPRLDRLRHLLPADQAAQLPAGNGRWTPFSAAQAAMLRRRYDRDMTWLAGGADGLARLIDPDTQMIAA